MNRIYGKGPKAKKQTARAAEKKIRNKMMINSYIISSVEMNMLLNNSFRPLPKRSFISSAVFAHRFIQCHRKNPSSMLHI